MSVRHTPGPWLVGVPDGHLIPIYAGAMRVAVVRASGIPMDEAAANAHLVEAAPELLEMLTSLHAVALRLIPVLDDDPKAPRYQDSELARLVEAAIKKAAVWP